MPDQEVALKDSKGVLVTGLDGGSRTFATPRSCALCVIEGVAHGVGAAATDHQDLHGEPRHPPGDGACIEFIHPGDFVFEQTQRDLDDMICVGHFFQRERGRFV